MGYAGVTWNNFILNGAGKVVETNVRQGAWQWCSDGASWVAKQCTCRARGPQHDTANSGPALETTWSAQSDWVPTACLGSTSKRSSLPISCQCRGPRSRQVSSTLRHVRGFFASSRRCMPPGIASRTLMWPASSKSWCRNTMPSSTPVVSHSSPGESSRSQRLRCRRNPSVQGRGSTRTSQP